MNAKQLAAALNGRPYRDEVPDLVRAHAEDSGLVIVYGSSNDLMEFNGAIYDDLPAHRGTTAYLTRAGLFRNECSDDNCPHHAQMKKYVATVEALWAKEPGYSWTFKTAIQHETFEIVQGGKPYCRGIVFALDDVPTL